MNHANNSHDSLSLDHDPTSKLPSKSSQPPLAMEVRDGKLRPSIYDRDGRVYLAKYYRTQLATGPACALAILAGAPAENMKTRMQSKHFVNAWDCAKYTWRTEGIRGFWAGTLAPMATITTTRVLGFSVYQKTKYFIDHVMEKSIGISPLNTVNETGTYPTLATNFTFWTSGAVAGASLSIVMTPAELIKTVQQTSVLMVADKLKMAPGMRTNQAFGTREAIKLVIQRHGILGLYTGFRLHLLRDTVGTAIYFGVYEAVKQSMTSLWGITEANTPGPVMVAGAVCGTVSWGATYPLDTLKTRVQNQLAHKPIVTPQEEVLSTLAAPSRGNGQEQSGLSKAAVAATKTARASTWRGIEMILLRSSIQNAVQMLLFETFKNKIMALEFSNGSRVLPKMRREKGRDRKVI